MDVYVGRVGHAVVTRCCRPTWVLAGSCCRPYRIDKYILEDHICTHRRQTINGFNFLQKNNVGKMYCTNTGALTHSWLKYNALLLMAAPHVKTITILKSPSNNSEWSLFAKSAAMLILHLSGSAEYNYFFPPKILF